MIELAVAKLRAKLFACAVGLITPMGFGLDRCRGIRLRGRERRGREEQVKNALLRGLFRAFGNFVEFFLTHHVDGRLHQIAHHGFDVAADVADLGVFRCFHLHERASGQPGEAPRDFRLADSGRADHQNVLGENVFRHFGREFLPADTVAQRDGNRALGGGLPDDVFI